MQNTERNKEALNNKNNLVGASGNFFVTNPKDHSTYSNNAVNLQNTECYQKVPSIKKNLIGNSYIVNSNNHSPYPNNAVNLEQTERHRGPK